MLLAFGFGNLAMLGWLAAAAAPVLIHLWTRTRYREVPWAAVEFLLAAMRKNARRIRLQQWLLLAVRTLLIALVVLAAAEPFWENVPLVGATRGPVHRVLVLDGSFSMDYRPDEQTLFAQAKELAGRMVQQSNVGDAFSLVLMGQPARSILSQPVIDRTTVVNEIAAIALPHGGGDLASALALIEASIEEARRENSHLTRHDVVFFTDLGRPTWQAVSSVDGGDDSTRQQLMRLANSAALFVVELGQADAGNLAVTKFEATSPFAALESDVQLRATVANLNDQPQNGLTVELLVDGAVAATRSIDVVGYGETTVNFSHRPHSPGTKRVAARVSGDRLEIDNTRWMALPVKEQLRVLCVAGKPGAADYVAAALNPDLPEAVGQSTIRPLVVPDGQLLDLDLGRFDCIFLCNVARFTSDESAILERYVRQGGGLVVFLGDRVLGDEYNRLPGDLWLPARLGEIVAESNFGIDPLDYRHPIVAPFRGRERAGLLTTPVYRYFRLQLVEQGDAELVLALAGGDPLIASCSVGQGRVLLVATAGSLNSIDATTGQPWTTMPAWPSFLPIVREMLLYAVAGRHQDQVVRVGMPLTGAVDLPLAKVTVIRPDGNTREAQISESLQGNIWSFEDTDLSGIYTAQVDSASRNSADAQVFAVNVDPIESDLTRINAEELPREIVVRNRWREADTIPADSRFTAHSQLPRGLLYAALLLALLEVWLAWLFGRGTL